MHEGLQAQVLQGARLLTSATRYGGKLAGRHLQGSLEQGAQLWQTQQALAQALATGAVLQQAGEYVQDAAQRLALTLDVLRERAENDAAHAAAGTPPVLDYAYTVVVDGSTLERPVNYQLLKILATEGMAVDDAKRPFMIIDPRAGHGAGIGGFKHDSQVGVALHAGHPVYFVVFRPHPQPGQTLADVMEAEAAFLREIASRHPHSGRPVVVGNCQGGWATLLLAAAHPQLAGPLVLNGSPVATWSGQIGENPMRYAGGVMGGLSTTLLAADLGGGEFDGAHLVSNFESLNPSRNYFGKYYDLFSDVEGKRESFLAFEQWWGGYHFTNEAEIRWIVEQLFIGNRLARGQAQLEQGKTLELRAIQAPIIVFASRGDNITPPQQALNWIVDSFADEHEIRVLGHRIVYMVHDKVGHLGIFVSSSVARKEHTEMTSTLETIEALPPGLYEMVIDATVGDVGHEHFTVSIHERRLQDILATVENDREQEQDFAAVARLSEFGAQAYALGLRPLVQSLVTPTSAQALRDSHPLRTSRQWFGSSNPLVACMAPAVEWAKAERQPAHSDNPFLALERSLAHSVMLGMDMVRDLRDASQEGLFLGLYGAPWMRALGQADATAAAPARPQNLRELPEVKQALACMERGDLAAATIRMLVLLADSRGSVRRDRLERSAQVLKYQAPFAAMGPQRRAELIQQQSIIAEFERERALTSLPMLLKTPEDRAQALATVNHILGARDDMEPHSLALIGRLEALLAPAHKASPSGAPKVTQSVRKIRKQPSRA